MRLVAVVITFHECGRNDFPIGKVELKIHQAREFLAWLERSIGRSREEECFYSRATECCIGEALNEVDGREKPQMRPTLGPKLS